MTAAGHRTVPHTADIRLEAWAPSFTGCIAEAVLALVGTIAEVGDARATGSLELELGDDSPPDVLASVLAEVIFLLDTEGLLPVGVRIERQHDLLQVTMQTTELDQVEVVGAAPKAVSLHELAFDRTEPGPDGAGGGWRCAVTIDI